MKTLLEGKVQEAAGLGHRCTVRSHVRCSLRFAWRRGAVYRRATVTSTHKGSLHTCTFVVAVRGMAATVRVALRPHSTPRKGAMLEAPLPPAP